MSAWMTMTSRLALAALALAGTVGGKTGGPNYYSPEQLARARQRCRDEAAAQRHVEGLREAVAGVMALTDEALWRLVPPAELVRATFLWQGAGNFPGCPVCGPEIFKAGGGFYPWVMRPDLPWKVTCPSCHTVFPSNDFASFYERGMTGECDRTGDFVDDGSGWVSPAGVRHYFVGHWGQKQRWMDILKAIDDLGELYRLTEEARYARTAAVLLCRLAQVYPAMEYARQSNYGALGRVLPWCWENTSVVLPVAITYDSIWPWLRDLPDEGLRAFLMTQGIADPCAHIDRGFLQDVAEKMIHTNQYLSNEGDHQRALAVVAVVWGDDDPAHGITTAAMLEWLMRGRGSLESMVWNDLYADGFPNEASPGYSSAVSHKVWEIARILERCGHDLFESPRFLATAQVWLDLTLCGRQQPAIGDYGSIMGGGRAGWNIEVLRWAWERYRLPRLAKAAMSMGNPAPGLYDPDLRAAIAAAAAAHPGPVVAGTRNLSQFGCALLESPHTGAPRGLSLYYGSAAGGHGHYDRLSIELYAEGRSMMPDLGYPDQWGAKAQNFHQNSTAHYLVQIDDTGQQTLARGRLHYLADLAAAQVVEASAEEAYPGLATTYRRTTALVDTSPETFYLLDIFRVEGGTRHDWLFHGPPQPGFESAGLELGPVRPGTLAGPEVGLGQAPAGSRRSGYEWLHSVREAAPSAAWSAIWPEVDGKAGLQMTLLPGCAQRVFIATADSPRIKAKGLPETLPWVVARREGGGLSTFTAVIRTRRDGDPIEAITPLAVTTPSGTGVAVRVVTAGTDDLLYSSLEPDHLATIEGGVQAAGRFVMIRRDRQGRFLSLHTVGASQVRAEGVDLQAQAEWRGTLRSVDLAANTATVDGLPASPALVGESLLFENAHRQTNFQVVAVDAAAGAGDGGAVAVVDFGHVSQIAGRGEVLAVRDEDRTVLTDTLWRTHGTMDIWAPGFHPALEGMALTRPDGSWHAVIEACQLFPDQAKEWWKPEADHGHFRLAGKGALGAALRPGDTYLVQAIVPGDTVSLPTRLVLTRPEAGLARLRTSAGQVALRLPEAGARAVFRPDDGRAPTRLATTAADGLRLDAAALAGGAGVIILAPDDAVDYADREPPALVSFSVDGDARPYHPDLAIEVTTTRTLALTWEDANPIARPEVVLAGRVLPAEAAGVAVAGVGTRRLTVEVVLADLVKHLPTPAVDDPPGLLVRCRDAAWSPAGEPVRLRLDGLGRPGPGAIYLSDLEAVVAQAHGGVRRDRDYGGDEGFELRGRHLARGLLVCPRADGPGEAVFDLTGHPDRRTLRASLGIADAPGLIGSVVFAVEVDDGADGWRRLYTSEVLRGGGAVTLLSLPLGPCRRLRLLCTDAGDSHNSDHAVWGDARLE